MSASPSKPTISRHTLARDPAAIHQLESALLAALTQHSYSHTCAFAVRQALQEALANAFKHGNRDHPSHTVTVEFTVDDNQLTIDIQDQGDGFDWHSVPDPTAEENLTIPAGRGIMLMRAYMTDVQYIEPGNRVRLTYVKPTAADRSPAPSAPPRETDA